MMEQALPRYRFILLAAFLAVANWAHSQQQVQFTQYMFSNLVINPAYAGADEAMSLTFINRNQWSDIKNAPRTQTLALHSLSKDRRTGLGLSLVNDRIGVHKSMNGNLVYAYHLKTGMRSVFSMGVQAGFQNIRSDYSSLTGSNNDPLVNGLSTNKTSFDFGSGLFFRANKFRAGLSVPSMISQYRSLNDRAVLNVGTVFGFFSQTLLLNQDFDIVPSTLIKYSPSLPLGFDVNVNLVYRNIITLGSSVRHNESMSLLLKAKVTEYLLVGYAYDHPFGSVRTISNGSNEIMLNYKSKPVSKRRHNRIKR